MPEAGCARDDNRRKCRLSTRSDEARSPVRPRLRLIAGAGLEKTGHQPLSEAWHFILSDEEAENHDIHKTEDNPDFHLLSFTCCSANISSLNDAGPPAT